MGNVLGYGEEGVNEKYEGKVLAKLEVIWDGHDR